MSEAGCIHCPHCGTLAGIGWKTQDEANAAIGKDELHPEARGSDVRIKVTFDMDFAHGGVRGQCQTAVGFEFVGCPEIRVPDNVRELVFGEIGMLCSVIDATGMPKGES